MDMEMDAETIEKLTYIKNIIKKKEEEYIARTMKEPDEEWYGDQFDILFHKSLRHLKILIAYKEKQNK